ERRVLEVLVAPDGSAGRRIGVDDRGAYREPDIRARRSGVSVEIRLEIVEDLPGSARGAPLHLPVFEELDAASRGVLRGFFGDGQPENVLDLQVARVDAAVDH